MTLEELERVLVAGVAECRSYPYNRPLNQAGDVLAKMAAACGTGHYETWRAQWSREQAERIKAEMGWR